RQLVQMRIAQDTAQTRDTRVVGARPDRPGRRFAVVGHGAKLVDSVRPAMTPQTYLRIERRATRAELHHRCKQPNQRYRHDEEHHGGAPLGEKLEPAVDAAAHRGLSTFAGRFGVSLSRHGYLLAPQNLR